MAFCHGAIANPGRERPGATAEGHALMITAIMIRCCNNSLHSRVANLADAYQCGGQPACKYGYTQESDVAQM